MLTPCDPREIALLDLAHYYGLTVYQADLPAGVRGRYYQAAHKILICRNLDSIQRVCTLAHELAHCMWGHDGAQSPEVEDMIEEEAARLLVPRHRFDEARERVGDHTSNLAAALCVTPAIVAAWLRTIIRTP